MIAREAVLHYQKQCMTRHVCVVLPQPCAQKHARAHPCHACAVPSMPVHIARRQRLSGSISDWRAYKVVRVKFLFSPYGKTVCPSGLRGWTQVPLARAAWVQIPQLSDLCDCGYESIIVLNTYTLYSCLGSKPTAVRSLWLWLRFYHCLKHLYTMFRPQWRWQKLAHAMTTITQTMVLTRSGTCKDSLPEWSKGVDSSSTSVSCVGSNPTAVTASCTHWL